ncbi:MAG: glycoside hydrolase family 66 protein, partial [Bacteroidota bacterium]|nr:glycoside hydrolase family 66 protein [Bacteroidota bacterium]
MKRSLLLFSLSICFLGTCYGCREYDDNSVPSANTLIKSISLSLDKASYSPGSTVTITSDRTLNGNYFVRYRQLGHVMADQAISGKTWTWIAPENDFTGYLAEVYRKDGTEETVIGSIGIDVSSDWAKFPRYGFLSDFGQLSQERITEVMTKLSRYHLNGLQYYDWHYDHQKPLAGTALSPSASWLNISSTVCYRSTINSYLKEAKARNMKSMFYNL